MSCTHQHTRERQRYYYPEGGETEFLCEDCAAKEGFCPGCGGFIGGIDAEIHYMQLYGVCSNCVSEIDEDSE